MNCFAANQTTDTVFKKIMISLQIKLKRGDEWCQLPIVHQQ